MVYELPPLPALLEQYRDLIAASVRPYVKITPIPARDTTLFESKFGGYPYLPLGTEYPKDSEGKEMALLAQINFAEVPPLDPLPRQGILQFYIPYGEGSGSLIGLDFERPTEQIDWRVIWFPYITYDKAALITTFSFLTSRATKYYPMRKKHFASAPVLRMIFEIDQHPLVAFTYEFAKLIPRTNSQEEWSEQFSEEELNAWGEYTETSETLHRGHRLGGYATFTQFDPRLYVTPAPSFMLLQIVSDQYFLWGDLGIAHLFISPEDLAARDFSRVYYQWDCY